MKLEEYFFEKNGTGVLATADTKGNVDAAIYARPYFFDKDRLGFLMRERLTYNNLKDTVSATYLFRENGEGYRGVRLYLEKIGQEDALQLLQKMGRRCLSIEEDRAKGPKHLVYFQVKDVLPLVGSGETGITA